MLLSLVAIVRAAQTTYFPYIELKTVYTSFVQLRRTLSLMASHITFITKVIKEKFTGRKLNQDSMLAIYTVLFKLLSPLINNQRSFIKNLRLGESLLVSERGQFSRMPLGEPPIKHQSTLSLPQRRALAILDPRILQFTCESCFLIFAVQRPERD